MRDSIKDILSVIVSDGLTSESNNINYISIMVIQSRCVAVYRISVLCLFVGLYNRCKSFIAALLSPIIIIILTSIVMDPTLVSSRQPIRAAAIISLSLLLILEQVSKQ